jgi:NTE family protein
MTGTGRLRVAIACRGGGSHTAFTAGVLERLLGAELRDGKVTSLRLGG